MYNKIKMSEVNPFKLAGSEVEGIYLEEESFKFQGKYFNKYSKGHSVVTEDGDQLIGKVALLKDKMIPA